MAKTIAAAEEYFKRISERRGQAPLFYRLIGYDDELALHRLLKRYTAVMGKSGVYLQQGLSNPTEEQVMDFYRVMGERYEYGLDDMVFACRKWLAGLNSSRAQRLGSALFEALQDLKNRGAGDPILKNAFVKLLCWCRFVCAEAVYSLGEDMPPKILYEGGIGKYGVMMLWVLAQAGCDVLYLNYESEEDYRRFDPDSSFSQALYGAVRKPPQVHFTEANLAAEQEKDELRSMFSGLSNVVVTNEWLSGSVFDAIEKKNSIRNLMTSGKINNFFVRYVGIDEKGVYFNRLFRLREHLKKGSKPWLLIEGHIPRPTPDETAEIQRRNGETAENLIYGLADQLEVSCDQMRQLLAKRAFVLTLSRVHEENLSRLFNQGVNLLCWCRRYVQELFAVYDTEHQPILLFYGGCTEREAEFLSMLALMGIDVLVLTPQKELDAAVSEEAWGEFARREELSQTLEGEASFPQKEVRMKVSTTAYDAERELDEMLYQGTGLFRDRQFTRSTAVTLKTTFEEIPLLWDQEAKYRPGFFAGERSVKVPNLFAKVCGVKESDSGRYFEGIREMLVSGTVLITDLPFVRSVADTQAPPEMQRFLKDGVILPDAIKESRGYQYDYLNEDTQDYILEKIQELLDLDWIQQGEGRNAQETILRVLLHLERRYLTLIQGFDFTKKIPKLLVVDATEQMFSLEECVLITFLNLIGFDIAVFTPTGYRNLEKYIKPEAYETHTIGPFLFDLNVPELSPKPDSRNGSSRETGFFNRLFGRGRS